MQLRYLEDIKLLKSTITKQSNGVKINTYTSIKNYKVQLQRLDDEVSASIYGADINKMYRVKSPNKELENYLKSKMDNTNDNISMYYIVYNNSIYKILNNNVDISRVSEYNTISI